MPPISANVLCVGGVGGVGWVGVFFGGGAQLMLLLSHGGWPAALVRSSPRLTATTTPPHLHLGRAPALGQGGFPLSLDVMAQPVAALR